MGTDILLRVLALSVRMWHYPLKEKMQVLGKSGKGARALVRLWLK